MREIKQDELKAVNGGGLFDPGYKNDSVMIRYELEKSFIEKFLEPLFGKKK